MLGGDDLKTAKLALDDAPEGALSCCVSPPLPLSIKWMRSSAPAADGLFGGGAATASAATAAAQRAAAQQSAAEQVQ